MTGFSKEFLAKPESANPAVRERILLARKRIQSVLDRDLVAHQQTLEQKISDQGPTNQRVDPHLVGLAAFDLLHLNRLRSYDHTPSGTHAWYSNIGAHAADVEARLDELGPLYASVSGHGFGNLTGDALEVVVYKCLHRIFTANPRYAYQGHFRIDQPKVGDRFIKVQPPKTIGSHSTKKEADFLLFGLDPGPICIECKNYREWIYPHSPVITDLIRKSYELNAIPVLIARRIHYTTLTNFLEPAGIIAHETYHQYYPSDKEELARKVKNARSLGFTDVLASEDPHPRTIKFFERDLFTVAARMSERWNANKAALMQYANSDINLAQLYTEIDSPAGGKWRDEYPGPY